MAEEHLNRFRRNVDLFRASPAQKLARMPLRLLYTKFLEQAARTLRRPVTVTARTFWDGEMTVVFPEQVSVSIARYGVFEEGLTSILMQHLKPGMVFYDVGAHFGYFGLLALWLVGDAGQVHAFEPTPSTFEVLTKNLGGKPNVRLNNAAVFREESTLSLSDYGLTFAAHNTLGAGKLDEKTRTTLTPTQVAVRALPLDAYVRAGGAKPDFVKVDAEGAELDILKGMGGLLNEDGPAISLEVGDPGAPGGSRDVLEYLTSRGYRPYEYRDGSIVPHQPRERYEYDNLLFKPVKSRADAADGGR